jgi:hypothetical protein
VSTNATNATPSAGFETSTKKTASAAALNSETSWIRLQVIG